MRRPAALDRFNVRNNRFIITYFSLNCSENLMINELSQLAPLTHVNISFHLRVVYCAHAALGVSLWNFTSFGDFSSWKVLLIS